MHVCPRCPPTDEDRTRLCSAPRRARRAFLRAKTIHSQMIHSQMFGCSTPSSRLTLFRKACQIAIGRHILPSGTLCARLLLHSLLLESELLPPPMLCSKRGSPLLVLLSFITSKTLLMLSGRRSKGASVLQELELPSSIHSKEGWELPLGLFGIKEAHTRAPFDCHHGSVFQKF